MIKRRRGVAPGPTSVSALSSRSGPPWRTALGLHSVSFGCDGVARAHSASRYFAVLSAVERHSGRPQQLRVRVDLGSIPPSRDNRGQRSQVAHVGTGADGIQQLNEEAADIKRRKVPDPWEYVSLPGWALRRPGRASDRAPPYPGRSQIGVRSWRYSRQRPAAQGTRSLRPGPARAAASGCCVACREQTSR
jgi:hypothetical protein